MLVNAVITLAGQAFFQFSRIATLRASSKARSTTFRMPRVAILLDKRTIAEGNGFALKNGQSRFVIFGEQDKLLLSAG